MAEFGGRRGGAAIIQHERTEEKEKCNISLKEATLLSIRVKYKDLMTTVEN